MGQATIRIRTTSIIIDDAPYKFLDTIATYIFYDDTTTIIMRETNKIVINSYGKLPKQWFQNRRIAYYMPLHLQYDKTENITTQIDSVTKKCVWDKKNLLRI